MKTKSTFLEKHSLSLFIILTPLISIAIPLFVLLPPEVVALAMATVPTIMAILLTVMTVGRKGVVALLQKPFQWLFVKTRGNLVIVILCHVGANYFGIFNEGIPAVENAWLQAVVMLAVAFVLFLLFGENLQRDPLKKPAVADVAQM